MKKRIGLLTLLGLAVAVPPAALILAQQAGAGRNGAMARPEGPCDIYAAANTPCVAAHSTTRALFAAYNGPLYQVERQSDGKKMDIGVVPASATDSGGYADAAVQDDFCANTYCWIATVYDQSGHKNDLIQAPRGGTGSPTAMGGFNSVPIADMAPVTVMGHKAYGIYIEPGMGLRQDNPHLTAVDDQAEGQYWVVNGHHYNGGCCFDYGNAEIDSRDDDAGTMETAYFGNATSWYHGPTPGPWIMTDQENNLVGCVTSDGTKNCDLPIIKWRFVTAMADGEPHHWRSMGGDAQTGELKIMFDGPRVNRQYDPMRKQGAIDMGNGGDNSNGSDGTIYEAAMTAGGTFPTQETNQKIQANIVAAGYNDPAVMIAPATAGAAPPGLQTFTPGSSQDTVVTFTNTSAAPVSGVTLSIAVPAGWTALASGGGGPAPTQTLTEPIAPGASMSATFKVTAGSAAFNGDLVGKASWSANGRTQTVSMAEKARSDSPIKINEIANNFIELYNAGSSDVDISNWSVTEHATQQAIFSAVKIPAGSKLAPKGFYLLGLSDSGLAVPAKKGDTTLYVRSAQGMNAGDSIQIDTGSGAETRKITNVGTEAAGGGGGGGGFGFGGGFGGGGVTTVWQPLPDGPVITIPAGSVSIPLASVAGIEVGQKVAVGYGATYPAVQRDMEKYEVLTVKEVGKPGTQTRLAGAANAGDTRIRVMNAGNISVGDKINLDIDSKDHGTETVTVTAVEMATPPAGGAPGGAGGGRGGRGGFGRGGGASSITLAAPLKFNHSANLPLSVWGTGITFDKPTAFAHSSNEPVLPLRTTITLDSPLNADHDINAVVRDEKVTNEGYQGNPAPNEWFGGPALTNAGNMVLRDAAGLVVDSLNWGGLVDPWAAEGYQGRSPGNGCSVPSFAARGGGRGGRGRGGAPADGTPPAARSAGRKADGEDTGSNCADFAVQAPTPGAPNHGQ